MQIHYRLFLALLFTVYSMASSANDKLSIPYEVRAEFRASGCEIVSVNEAARTDLGRQKIYVAVCSGVDTYLMAVKCRRTSCQTLR